MNQQIWSREQFEQFLRLADVTVYLQPARVVPCTCRDLNCHGWRLERAEEAVVDLPREPERELATV